MHPSGFVCRRRAEVLLVGAVEPEVQPWLHAAGHATRTVAGLHSALRALGKAPADLVVADRDRAGLDAHTICRGLRDDHRLGEAWLLAITTRAAAADAALDAGADDYLHRPFTRAQLLARVRAGLRAVQQRADSA